MNNQGQFSRTQSSLHPCGVRHSGHGQGPSITPAPALAASPCATRSSARNSFLQPFMASTSACCLMVSVMSFFFMSCNPFGGPSREEVATEAHRLFSLKDYDDAADYLKEHARIYPVEEDSAEMGFAYMQCGQIMSDKWLRGERGPVADLFMLCISYTRHFSPYDRAKEHLYFGSTLYDVGRYGPAEAAYKSALAYAPDSLMEQRALDSLGVVALRIKEIEPGALITDLAKEPENKADVSWPTLIGVLLIMLGRMLLPRLLPSLQPAGSSASPLPPPGSPPQSASAS